MPEGTLLYGCETWPMSGKDEKRMATTDEDGAMGNGGEPTGTSERWEYPRGSKGGTDRTSWEGECWNGSGTLNEEMKQKTSEQLSKWRWRGSALEEDRSWGGKTLSKMTWKPGTSGRNGPLTGNDVKVCKTCYPGQGDDGEMRKLSTSSILNVLEVLLRDLLSGFAKLTFFKKSPKKLDRAHPTHHP